VYSGNKPFVPPGGDGGGATTGPRVINVNTATQAELESVPGIGPVLAGRIITWRTANGPFQALSDLTKVSGIGEKKLQDMQPYLTLK
jgi:competence protein ComEA